VEDGVPIIYGGKNFLRIRLHRINQDSRCACFIPLCQEVGVYCGGQARCVQERLLSKKYLGHPLGYSRVHEFVDCVRKALQANDEISKQKN